ncbi:MAG: UDP-3-O-acyl-N-acetylglucosamine deacetylase, partial [Cyanobacteria bacterium]|nr:UDP-3-O-acyl-N-acetylglucosamine deacetylase [Cyanobacteriota bacterium]
MPVQTFSTPDTLNPNNLNPKNLNHDAVLTLEGHGLISGLPVKVSIQKSKPGEGICFQLEDGTVIPARLETVVNTNRGVTLAYPNGKYLSIVEHFLCACSLLGLTDLRVMVEGAPELPILDGSASVWYEALLAHFGNNPAKIQPQVELPQAVFVRISDSVCLYALPADHLKITYAVDFPHPDLKQSFGHWDSLADGPEAFLSARTFGMLRDLPILQAQGLAKGVSLENTLGLTDEGEYTTSLRMEDEPLN